MRFIKWLGRVTLWMFPPIGLWRSVKHGKDKRHDELIKVLKEK